MAQETGMIMTTGSVSVGYHIDRGSPIYERLCRALCRARGVDPDRQGSIAYNANGHTMVDQAWKDWEIARSVDEFIALSSALRTEERVL